ncbi:CWC16 protein [Chlamydoabsidia padenii]|nr:CWC16 protein [Chlamydoabsidia padenii]
MQPTNKYYPPDWTPEKGTANKFVGKHPLGDRARKLDKGILIVRFELPFNIWCTGCDSHVGKGVRYNAEKKQIGKYYSTPILQFRMKCHLCSHWIEIHTDPKNAAYVVVSGAREKTETWTPDQDDHVLQLNDQDTKERLAQDPMYRLEHGIQDKAIKQSNSHVLTRLEQLNEAQWKDPYTQSQHLRRKFRQEKKKDQAVMEQTNQLKDKYSLHIDLVAESQSDLVAAKLVDFSESGRLGMDRQKLETSTASLFSHNNNKVNTVDAKDTLEQRARRHTKLKTDPFLQHIGFKKSTEQATTSPLSMPGIIVRPVKRIKTDQDTMATGNDNTGLVDYPDSDSD